MSKREFRPTARPTPTYPTEEMFEPRRRSFLLELGAAMLGVALLGGDAGADETGQGKGKGKKKPEDKKKPQPKRPPHTGGIRKPPPRAKGDPEEID